MASYYIIKRDGTKDRFNIQKIKDAILKAFLDVDGKITDYAEDKANKIAEYIAGYMEGAPDEVTIDTIQKLVEHGLMATKRKDVATSYIEYRHDRDQVRKWNNQMMQAMKSKLQADDIEQQNANVDEQSFGGRKGEADAVILKQYALDNCMSKKSKERHLNNEIYIHDLSEYALGDHNCLTVPFDKLLANGFNTRQTDVRPANSINTAFQLVAVIFQLQSLMQFGGVSASHLDWTMVPYIRKSFNKHFCDGLKYIENEEKQIVAYKRPNGSSIEKVSIEDEVYQKYPRAYKYAMDMTIKETNQAAEGMFHNLNTLQSRSGNQLPFTSINFGTCTLSEGRMVIKALLEGSIKGVGKFHKTSVFPCSIFQYMKDVNDKPGTPNYDLYKLALESTAKRLYPNYANVDWSGNAGYNRDDPKTYFSTMGCRTANGWDINGFGQMKDGRGNICPVTIILPTIAMEVKEKMSKITYTSSLIDAFMGHLNLMLYDAKDMLIERFDYICSQDPSSAKFMYENGTMEGYHPEEGIRSALKHGTLAIGQLGLAVCLQILIGCDHTTPRGMDLAKKIEQLFKDRCAEFKEEYHLNFGVYFTPAENLCYTAMKKFQSRWGKIPKISDKEYFTNSTHVPVWKEISPFEKIDIESELTGYSSAGCITYVELDAAAIDNLEALESIVCYAMDKDIPYFAINVPNDLCIDCGYAGVIPETCPECGGKKIQRLRRVTGYLTGDYKTAFNKGKIAEVEDRYKHSQKLKGWK